jgi:hypothetical protein
MKPISNFRDHPALKYDEQRAVFVIKHSVRSELYLYTEKEVKRIIPLGLEYTNIGEPYAELVRFNFSSTQESSLGMNENEEDSLDIDPNDLQDLVNMMKSMGFECISPERFARYLDDE